MPLPRFNVIIALHNEEKNITELVRRLSHTFKDIEGMAEFWFIDDGSTDNTCQEVIKLSQQDARIRLIKLSRNFGHHKALFAGITECNEADYFLLMDGDLQDRPEDIPLLLEGLKDGSEIVYGIRQQRTEGWLKRKTSGLFWKLINRLSGQPIPAHQSVMRVFSSKVRKSLLEVGDYHKFLAGIFAWVGYKHSLVRVKQDERFAGTTSYSFVGLISQTLQAITGFSAKPLRLITYAGLGMFLLSFVYALYLVIQKLMFHPPAGWTFLAVSILFSSGLQMISMGIIAEYLAKLFQQSQGRPVYIVESVHIPDSDDEND